MKAILTICSIVILTIPGLHAQKSINKFIDKHKQKQHSLAMTLPGWLIRTGFNQANKYAEDQDEKAIYEIGKHIKQLRFLVIEKEAKVPSSEITELIAYADRRDKLESYTTIRDGDTTVNVLMKEKDDKIKNLVIITSDNDHLAVVNIKADLPFEIFRAANFSFNQE